MKNILEERKTLLKYVRILFLSIFVLLTITALLASHDTSKGNVFETEKGKDKLNYFKNQDLLESGAINQNNTKKIFVEIKDINCNTIERKIINENTALIDIFALKTDSLHNLIISLIMFNSIMFFLSLIFLPFIKFMYHEKSKGDKNCFDTYFCCCYLMTIIFFYSIILTFFIMDIILFSSFLYKYSIDETNIYLEFLECSNINKDGFNKYSILQGLPIHCSFFIFFQIIFIISIIAHSAFLLFYLYKFEKEIEEEAKEAKNLKYGLEYLIN